MMTIIWVNKLKSLRMFYILNLVLVVKGKEYLDSFEDCGCWVNVFLRQPCEYGGFLDRDGCLREGCCYDDTIHTLETHKRPFCYSKTGSCPTDEMCKISGSNRRVCGHYALDKPLCELRGCCFDISQQPMCYYRKEMMSPFLQPPPTFPANIPTTSLITPSAAPTIPTSTPSFGTTMILTTTKSPKEIVYSGPFGYYYLDGLLVVFRCASQGLPCGSINYDKKSCLDEQCCWHENTFDKRGQCILPAVNVTKLSSPLKWGLWSEWSHWSDCDGSPCDIGKQVRIRKCGNSDEKLNGICFGEFWEEKICTNPCSPSWTAWGTWTNCPSLCSPALKKRTRKCFLEGLETDLDQCYGGLKSSIEDEPCQMDYCHNWSEWEVTACSAYCGQGYKIKHRNCLDPRVSGKMAPECSKEVFPCREEPCFRTSVIRHRRNFNKSFKK